MGYQITLFDIILQEKANSLLDTLNEGQDAKDFYISHSALRLKNKIVLAAVNARKEMLYNIVDRNGDAPAGLSKEWRPIEIITSDLKISI